MFAQLGFCYSQKAILFKDQFSECLVLQIIKLNELPKICFNY